MNNLLHVHSPASDLDARPLFWGHSPNPAPPHASPGGEVPFPTDLTALSTRQLRTMCNQTYQLMDTPYPPLEVRERYEALVEELEAREHTAQLPAQPEPPGQRGTFRDNVLYSRFELYREGLMAGYVKYELRGGEVLLIQAVIDRRFRSMGLEPVLMQSVLMNAHRRRLDIAPYCAEAQEFLRENPQFLRLLLPHQRIRFQAVLEG
ncbi:N-acetyltransferase [Arthrobacter sp. TMN-37]